jgi:hypothetical protein
MLKRLWLYAPALVVLCGLAGGGCDDDPAAPVGQPSPGPCVDADTFRVSDFTNSSWIDNRWFPLLPGKQWILDGTANRGGGVIHHRVVFTVTNLIKVIDGVTTVVLWDRDYNGDELVEAELAFFAQDRCGRVWSLGEYPEEYERGEFLGAPSTWLSGQGGAKAGVHMVLEPLVGTRFLQGWAPEINFLDSAVVYQENQRVCVTYNCFENVLVTDEWSPLEPGSGHQRKFYAPGMGIVKVTAVEDPEAETLQLVNVFQLSPQVLEEANVEALRLDARAYENVDFYSSTAPARRRP